MKKVLLEIEVADDFVAGVCKGCRFARGSDQCKLVELLTKGTCSLQCFCPLKGAKILD